MRSLVMSDIETKTEWAHLLGKAMAGPLKGKKLKPIVTDMVTWQVWKNLHPDTTVLNMSDMSRNYTSNFYDDPTRFVFGFEVDGDAGAVAMDQLLKKPVHQFEIGATKLLTTFDKSGAVTHLFERTLDDQALDFKIANEGWMTDSQTGSRWKILDGLCVEGALKGKMLRQRVGIMSFRKAWENFHPNSQDVVFP